MHLLSTKSSALLSFVAHTFVILDHSLCLGADKPDKSTDAMVDALYGGRETSKQIKLYTMSFCTSGPL